MEFLYDTIKVLHFAAFITGIGLTISTYAAHQQFWKLLANNPAQGMSAFKAFSTLQKVSMFSLIVVLASGLTMFALTSWVYVVFLWFQIKLGLVVLLLINFFTNGKAGIKKMQAFMMKGPSQENLLTEAIAVKKHLTFFQVSQLCIFALIIILSVFRIS